MAGLIPTEDGFEDFVDSSISKENKPVRTLAETLNVRRFDNSVMGGKLQEIFRGNSEIRSTLRGSGLMQVTYHILTPERAGGNHIHRHKIEIMSHLQGNPQTSKLPLYVGIGRISLLLRG